MISLRLCPVVLLMPVAVGSLILAMGLPFTQFMTWYTCIFHVHISSSSCLCYFIGFLYYAVGEDCF
jgi:hypothetical protein